MSNHLNVLRKLKTKFPYYSQRVLKIQDKTGNLIPFRLNFAQMYTYERLMAQQRQVGFIRALFLKGRQQGLSTFTEGFYFHDTYWEGNKNAFILAHHSDSTDHLFGMVKRFYDNQPEPLKQKLQKRNEDEIIMHNNSQYAIGTARSGEIGRGRTIQLFHGSEVAFWENSANLARGVLNAVAEAKGTSVIFESTSNGPGDFFHSRAMQAQQEEDPRGFQLIFIPWFWQPEYTRPAEGMVLTNEEALLLEVHGSNGLTIEHLAWRRKKIEDNIIGGDEEAAILAFKREYPNTVEEAFETSGRQFFNASVMLEAIQRWKNRPAITAPVGGRILGVDPGRDGDPTGFAFRIGRRLEKVWDMKNMNQMRLAGIIINLIQEYDLDKVFIDVGHGYGTFDRIVELGWGQYIQAVHFGERATRNNVYRNKRAEMHGDYRDWLADGGEIPDCGILAAEMHAIPEEKETSNSIKYLVPKEEIKKLIGRSPNRLDAVILTFAEPVRARDREREQLARSHARTKPQNISQLDRKLGRC